MHEPVPLPPLAVEALLAQLERTVPRSGALICTAAPERTVVWCSPGAARLAGRAAQELSGRAAGWLYGPDTDRGVVAAVDAALAAGRPAHALLKLYRPDGTSFWTELSGLPLRAADGRLTHHALLLRDVHAEQRERSALAGLNDNLERLVAERTQHLLQLEDDYASLFEHAIEGIFRTTPDGRYLSANPALARLYGYAGPEALMAALTDIGHQLYVDPHRRAEFAARLARDDVVRDFESEVQRADGATLWISESARAVRDSAGGLVCYEGTVVDISQRRTAEAALAKSEQRFRQLVEQATDAFIVIDAQGCIADVNEHGCRSLGYAREQLIGRPYAALDPAQTPPRLAELATRLAAGPLTHETHHRRHDGSEVPVEVRYGALDTEDGPRVLAICRDISERRALEAQLRFQSTHDALTGLPNRSLLEDRLNMAVAHARRRGRLVGVLCLDLIRFKQLVDTLGHAVTDDILRETARRLVAVVRPGDTVSRQAGDTYTIVLDELVGEERASQIAGRLREALAAPVPVGDQEVFIDASIGIAVFPRDGSDSETLLRHAASAMQRARQHPRNEPQFYAAEMNTWTTERLGLEGKLRRALDGDELLLYYQPQIELHGHRIVGAEALLRWRHPELGMISPAEFIPLAEETGLILPIGDWVLRTACEQARDWRAAGLPELRICVNLSALQFAQPDLADDVAAVLADTGLPPAALELEITESVLMRDVEAAAATVRTLNAMGVQLALDDFGTGYSSLAYLKRFRIDRLKIDRSFVRDITTDPDDAAITLAVIALAHSLRKSVIAEGVETEEQRHFLSERGCDEVQGYFFSEPLPAAAMTELLAGRRQLANGLIGVETEEPPTVLLVDDDPVFTTFGCAVLRGEACRVLTANSGREALDLLARNRVDVIVSDKVMPGMDGADFLRRTRALYPDACRIMLSGCTTLQSLIDSINEGGIHKFLEKPVAPERLRAAVREALGRRGSG